MRLNRVLLLLTLLAQPVAAQEPAKPNIGALLRAGNWAAADAAARALPDPIAVELVRFRRLLVAGAASAAEIAAFTSANPTWPMLSTLARRRDEALAADPLDTDVAALCAAAAPAVALPSAELRCADAFEAAGDLGAARRMLRRAWIGGPSDAAWEARVAQRAGASLTALDQWARFDRLAWSDTTGATRQAARLDAADKPRAEARLALRRDDASAMSLVAVLPADQRADPTLVLEEVRWLNRAGQDQAAQALWRDQATAAERAAPAERRAAFWAPRNRLARRLLRLGDAAGAYGVVSDHAQTAAETRADAEFLAGFIALRRLGDVEAAARHFGALARLSTAPITQARALFWLGRAHAAGGDASAAAASYRQAAEYPTTFYGQLAAIALGEAQSLAGQLAALRPPPTDAAAALALASRDLARAASLMVAWGEPRLAAGFLGRLADTASTPAERAMTARFAQGLGLPDVGVAIARRASRDGIVLLDAGWPVAADVPASAGVDPALALGLIRQESSFNAGALSPAGARGLMQLMPGTAAATARLLGIGPLAPALVVDPALNLRLGTALLHSLMERYGGAVPLVLAAYNAGPGRVADWLGANGDPRAGSVDAIDWIELIGIDETRNYVQRVIENTVIYRAKLHESEPHPLTQWLR